MSHIWSSSAVILVPSINLRGEKSISGRKEKPDLLMKTSALLGLFVISTYRFQGFIMPISMKLKKHNNKSNT